MAETLYFTITDHNNGTYLIKYFSQQVGTNVNTFEDEIVYRPVFKPSNSEELLAGARKAISNRLVRNKTPHRRMRFMLLTKPQGKEPVEQPKPASKGPAIYSICRGMGEDVVIRKHKTPYLTETEAKQKLFEMLNGKKD